MIINLLHQIELHVTNLLLTRLPPGMVFHNLNHTRQMVAAVSDLAEQMLVNEWECQILKTAAWFHDTGYCYGYHGHEAISMTLANEFLRDKGIREAFINPVNDCIRATVMPQAPNTVMQKIISDSDMCHLGMPDYELHADNLRQEWAGRLHKSYTDREWLQQNIAFMESHQYFTAPAKLLWEPQKQQNLQTLREKFEL